MSTVARERPGQVLPRLGQLVLECSELLPTPAQHPPHAGQVPKPETSVGLFWQGFSREMWKLSTSDLPFFASAPPYLQQKLPRGFLALRVPPEWSHSWPGWGLFSFFGSSLLFQGLPPPHQWSWSTSPFWLPQLSSMPKPRCQDTSQVAMP